jgi:hypothetical protein
VRTTAHHDRHHCRPSLTVVGGGGGRPGRSSPPLMTTVLLNCHCRHPQSPPSPTLSLPRKAATVSEARAVPGGNSLFRAPSTRRGGPWHWRCQGCADQGRKPRWQQRWKGR